jgi:hypothetical protein
MKFFLLDFQLFRKKSALFSPSGYNILRGPEVFKAITAVVQHRPKEYDNIVEAS